MSNSAFERGFPSRAEAVIGPHIWGEQRTPSAFAQIFDRAKLDLDLPLFHHSRIRSVEWPIGLRRATPQGEESCQRPSASRCPHGDGRNTQIVAGSVHPARTATNSRSSSGTKSEVRAPDAVGTRVMRR